MPEIKEKIRTMVSVYPNVDRNEDGSCVEQMFLKDPRYWGYWQRTARFLSSFWINTVSGPALLLPDSQTTGCIGITYPETSWKKMMGQNQLVFAKNSCLVLPFSILIVLLTWLAGKPTIGFQDFPTFDDTRGYIPIICHESSLLTINHHHITI